MGVYFIAEDFDGYVKVGFPNNISRRVTQLQTGNHRPLMLMGYLKSSSDDSKDSQLENAIHTKCKDKQISREWYNLSPEKVLEILQTVHTGSNDYDGFLSVGKSCLEIIGNDRDGISELGEIWAWDWGTLDWGDCCPFCGCLCGLIFQENIDVHECLNCGYAFDSDFGELARIDDGEET